MPPTREEKLANQVMESILVHDPNCQPQYLSDQSLIFIPEGAIEERPATAIQLNTFYSELVNLSESEQAKRISDFVSASLSLPIESVDQRLANLRLRVRTRESVNCRQDDLTETVPPILFGDGSLVLELVENAETHIKPVNSDLLDTLSIGADQAYSMAALAHRRSTDGNQWQSIGNVWMSSYQDAFDFSRLMIAGRDTHLPFQSSTVIAYAPSHSVCLITDQQDAHSLEQLVSIGDQLSTDQRPLSKHLWTLSDLGEWIQYELGIDPEAARVIKIQEIRENTGNYAEQQSLLEENVRYRDHHIASYVGFEIESGEIFSNATYTLNQATSLPKTDIVSLYDNEAEAIIGMMNWEEFAKIAGATLKPETDSYPQRYSLPENLSELQLEMIRKELLTKVA